MRVLAILACLLLPQIAFAQSLPTVHLLPGEDSGALLKSLRYTSVDRGFSVQRDLDSLNLDSLVAIPYPDIEFGIPKLPILVMLKVRNRGSEPATWTLSTDRASLRRIELFQVADNQLQMMLKPGDIAEQKRQLRHFHAFAFDFSLQPGEERLLGILFEAENSSRLPLTIQTPSNAQQRIISQGTTLLIAFTATFTLILINALLFLLTRRKAFLYFVIAELALLYQTVHQQGYTTIYLFSDHAELGRILAGTAKAVFAGFSVKFAREFLRIRETSPTLNQVLAVFEAICWMVIGCLVLYPLIPGLNLRTASYFSFGVATAASLFLPFIALWAVRKYGLTYLPLVLSWSIFGAFLVYTALAALNVVPGLTDHWRWFAPVGFLEAFFLSVALALDIRQIQNREIHAQTRLANELRERMELLVASTQVTRQRDLALQELVDSSQLVSAAGHDSRNFVSALKIYNHKMATASDLATVHDYGQRMGQIIEHLDHTISLAMDNSRGAGIDEGLLCIEPINAHSLVTSLKLMYEQTARKNGVELICRGVDFELSCDRNILIRALGNLISNAIKYSNGKKVLITARRYRNGIRFQVWDQGAGIPHNKLTELLDPSHARQRYSPDVEGSGSGISICQQLCSQIKASLLGRSQEDRGTVFEIQIASAQIPTSQNITVAIVDDLYHWPQELLNNRRLGRIQFKLHQSVASANKTSPHFILLDPSSTDEAIKISDRSILIICSYDQSMPFRQEWAANAHVILQKPVTADTLAAALTLSTGTPE